MIMIDFDECIYDYEDCEQCDPVNLKCNGNCQGASSCILNPYSEWYNKPMDEFKEFIEGIRGAQEKLENDDELKRIIQEVINEYMGDK
jgi:hypothetical protein